LAKTLLSYKVLYFGGACSIIWGFNPPMELHVATGLIGTGSTFVHI